MKVNTMRFYKNMPLKAMTATLGLALIAAPSLALASGYTYSTAAAYGANQTENPAKWSTGYGVMQHSGSTVDGFLIPLTFHESGDFAYSANSISGQISGVDLGSNNACIQVVGVNQFETAVYGGSTNCDGTPYLGQFNVAVLGVTVPASGYAYAWVTGSSSVKFALATWETSVN